MELNTIVPRDTNSTRFISPIMPYSVFPIKSMSAIFFGMTTSRTRNTVSPSAAEAASHCNAASNAVRDLVRLLARAAAHECSQVTSVESSPPEEPTDD